jgi:hypothetical protein
VNALIPLALLLPTLAAAAPFQGVLTGRMYGPHASGTSRALVSPDGLRNELEVETPASRASGADKVRAISLYRSAEPDRVYVLDPVRRAYRVDPVRKSAATARAWKLQRKGRGEVAGLPCEQVLLTSREGDRIDACVSAEVGRGAGWLRAVQEGDAGVAAGSSRALAAAGLSGYPLRWVLEAKGGASALTLEVTGVERREIPASTFAVPAGFARSPAR